MNKLLVIGVSFILSLSSFIFGWLSHSAYQPPKQQVSAEKNITHFEKIKKRKSLNVVLLNAPSTYYIGADGPSGFEYDLIEAYAKNLGVDLNITAVHTVKEALEYTDKRDIDIISASLSKTPKRQRMYNFGPSYFEVQEQVICNRKMLNSRKFPRDIEELTGLSIMVGENTSYFDTLESLIKDGYDINMTVTSEHSTEELLEMVSNRQIDCTVADSNIYAINLKYLPELAMAFSISGREQLAWVLPIDAKELEADLYTWLNSYVQTGKMTRLKDHYYSYALFFDYYNTKVFYNRIKISLPTYKKLFQEAAKKYNLSWTLLAAISYQESHWNPNAKSFTGVKGLMMLTLTTAKSLGVKNRRDPKQSIYGGAKHLENMLSRISPEVEGEDRTKFALAAYNIGMGHIHDARTLAKRLGLNHNTWKDLKIVLPLLSQKKYYQNLSYGYARGSEPVKYVEAIYDYKSILDKLVDEEGKRKVETEQKQAMLTQPPHE